MLGTSPLATRPIASSPRRQVEVQEEFSPVQEFFLDGSLGLEAGYAENQSSFLLKDSSPGFSFVAGVEVPFQKEFSSDQEIFQEPVFSWSTGLVFSTTSSQEQFGEPPFSLSLGTSQDFLPEQEIFSTTPATLQAGHRVELQPRQLRDFSTTFSVAAGVTVPYAQLVAPEALTDSPVAFELVQGSQVDSDPVLERIQQPEFEVDAGTSFFFEIEPSVEFFSATAFSFKTGHTESLSSSLEIFQTTEFLEVHGTEVPVTEHVSPELHSEVLLDYGIVQGCRAEVLPSVETLPSPQYELRNGNLLEFGVSVEQDKNTAFFVVSGTQVPFAQYFSPEQEVEPEITFSFLSGFGQSWDEDLEQIVLYDAEVRSGFARDSPPVPEIYLSPNFQFFTGYTFGRVRSTGLILITNSYELRRILP